ncbi:MAG TPA: GNAT family protein [Acidimicrobiales bacterium]|nr:GNAT family protein [Acidimicrobiales bacterium]
MSALLRSPAVRSLELAGRRVRLATLVESDYPAWLEVRKRCRDWLVPWEPRSKGAPLPAEDQASFAARCAMRERERQLGSGFGFGIFHDGRFSGEVTLSSIQRGPFQNGAIGYWIDRDVAGKGLTPESVVVVLRFAFETLRLHRIEVAIIPRNVASRRVADKLRLRDEGTALGFLEIDGAWEDHVRYAMTSEEWTARAAELRRDWLD